MELHIWRCNRCGEETAELTCLSCAGDTTYQEMTIDYLGDMATEYDLRYFQSACEAYQSRTGCSDREAPDYIWGDGDWLQRGYEELGDGLFEQYAKWTKSGWEVRAFTLDTGYCPQCEGTNLNEDRTKCFDCDAQDYTERFIVGE